MTKQEKKQQLLRRLAEIAQMGDPEAAHSLADDALLEYINDSEITEAYENIQKWYA